MMSQWCSQIHLLFSPQVLKCTYCYMVNLPDAGAGQTVLGTLVDFYYRNAEVSIANIFHNPATIVNPSMAWEVAKFSNAGTAAVVNQIGDRQQMVWFMPFALDW